MRSPALLLAAAVSLACGDEAQVIDVAGEAERGAEGVESRSNPLDVDSSTPVPGENPAGGDPPPAPPPAVASAPAGASSGGSQGAPAPPAAPVPARELRGACPLAQRIGGFSVEAQVDFGVVQGAVADSVLPTAVPRLAGELGTCRLQERRILVCLPACGPNEACGESGSCQPYPRQLDVGVVDISGLTRPTSMSPLPPGNTYFSPGADNPPYASDARVVLSAPGGSGVAPFELLGSGSEPLVEAPSWRLQRGSDLQLSWAAPTAAGAPASHVLVELSVDQHGATPLSLSCELADTGSASVPAALIDQLLDSGVSGFPNGRILRRTADHVLLAQGCVELVVGSPRAANVSVAGYTPCNDSSTCPAGQTCNTLLQRCEAE